MPTYPSSQKTVALARALAENLALRTGLAAVSGTDGSMNPTVRLGTGAAGAAGCFIRVKVQSPSEQVDALWNEQRVYTPNVAQVVFEGPTAATGADTVANTLANISKIIFELAQLGTKVEIYETAGGNAPDVADIVTANKKATLESLWHPLTETI